MYPYPIPSLGPSLGTGTWVTGTSVKDNLDKLRSLVIPKVERWASASGAIFNAGKTILIHFTRTKRFAKEILSKGLQLHMGNKMIKALTQAKLLGVVFDSLNAALALKRLHNLRPEISRRLFRATVSPVVDYPSPIWALGCTKSSLAKLNVIQKIEGQAIIGCFKTVARNVMEVEAGMETVESRHQKQIQSALVKWHTRPTHRFWKIKA